MNSSEHEDWVEWPAVGASMGRRWRTVGTLLVRPAGMDAIRWGDVVVAGIGDRRVAHRAVRRIVMKNGEPGWITKGDGSVFPDRWVIDGTSIQGIVEAVRHRDGAVIILRRRYGLLPVVTGWMLSWLWRPVEANQASA